MATTEWYAVFYTTTVQSKFGAPDTSYALVQAPSSAVARTKVAQLKGANAIIGSVNGPYSTRNEALKAAQAQLGKVKKQDQKGTVPGIGSILGDLNPLHWLSSIGGAIASGIESGFIAVIKDLWDVIIGPLEVILGAIIVAFVLAIYFKDDLMAAVRMIGLAAA